METDMWMRHLKEYLKDKRLSDIVLPGTHNSGSYCITRNSKRTNSLPNLGPCLNPVVDEIGAEWSKTQNLSIQDQLKAGIRYLDLRVYLDNDDKVLYLVHGLEGKPLYDELAVIHQFVDTHPSEVVILDINHVYQCSESNVDAMLQKLESLFKNRILTPVPKNQKIPTYSQLMDSKQTIIISLCQKDISCNLQYKFCEMKDKYPWIWNSETNIISPWANTTNPVQLKMFLQETMAEPRPSNALHVTQAILTPQMADTLLGVFRPPRNLKQLADKLTPDLSTWFNELYTLDLNIIILDFLDHEYIKQLINLNKSGRVAQFQCQ